MVRISRILKDFRETGALNSLIALWGFVDDTTFLTKAGAVGVLYRLQGVDFECLDHPQRQAIAHRFEQALRQLDESFRVYQYVLKRPAPVVTAAAHPHPVVDEALRRRTTLTPPHRRTKRAPLYGQLPAAGERAVQAVIPVTPNVRTAPRRLPPCGRRPAKQPPPATVAVWSPAGETLTAGDCQVAARATARCRLAYHSAEAT